MNISRERVLEAIDAEPELTDEIPAPMAEALSRALATADLDVLVETMRIVARLTKRGIRERIEKL